jgi:hypothetical protein
MAVKRFRMRDIVTAPIVAESDWESVTNVESNMVCGEELGDVRVWFASTSARHVVPFGSVFPLPTLVDPDARDCSHPPDAPGSSPDFALYFSANAIEHVPADESYRGLGFGIWRASAVEAGTTLVNDTIRAPFPVVYGRDFVLQATWSGGSYSSSEDLVVESPSLDELYVDPDAVEQQDGLWRVHAGWYDATAKVVRDLVAVFGDPTDACTTWDAAWDAVAPGPPPSREQLRRLLPPGSLTLAQIEAHEVFGKIILRNGADPRGPNPSLQPAPPPRPALPRTPRQPCASCQDR